jgi:hypothetical protein
MMDKEIDKKIQREVKRRMNDSREFLPHEIPKPEDNFERGVGGLSKNILTWIAGIILTSILSLNVWVVSEIYSHDKRISLLEENTKIMMEFKNDVKEIKDDIADLKTKVTVINLKLEGR